MIAKYASDEVDYFAVATADEALNLKKYADNKPIMILGFINEIFIIIWYALGEMWGIYMNRSYNIELIWNYINGYYIENVDELENDYKFMMKVISITKDKNYGRFVQW